MDAYLDRLLDELVPGRARGLAGRSQTAPAARGAATWRPSHWSPRLSWRRPRGGSRRRSRGTPAPPKVKADLRFGNKIRAEIAKTLW
jgi:hypothetical protein